MKDRLIASGIHLGISLLVALLILVLLFLIWFPSPLMNLGAVQGVQLILLVDLVVGPLLTLLVFKKGKSSLVFDMSVIIGLQIAALVYGLTTVYGQTPAFIVQTHEGLLVVNRYEIKTFIDEKDLQISDEVAASPTKYANRIPVYLLPETLDIEQRGLERMTFQFNEGLPYHFNLEEFQPFDGFDYLLEDNSARLNTSSYAQECVELLMVSPHGSAEVCLYQDGDSIELAR